MKQVSVLVPIYNAAKFLRQALDSLVGQTLTEVEIICINDGSTDDSLRIIQEYAQKDVRISVIDKSNTGYGDSMNQGIKRATGEYIGILEPDDYLEPDAYEKLYQLATWQRADIVKANYYLLAHDQNQLLKAIRAKDTGKVIDPHTAHFVFRLPPAIWSGIYRREFLREHQIEFLPTPGASYQDIGFNIKTLALAQRVILTDQAYLHYRVDNDQASSKSRDKISCVVDEYTSIEQFLRAHHLWQDLAPAIVSAKFGNYLWNMRRLPAQTASDFYQTTLTELRAAQAQGLLQRTEFSAKYWLILQAMLKAPRLAAKLITML